MFKNKKTPLPAARKETRFIQCAKTRKFYRLFKLSRIIGLCAHFKSTENTEPCPTVLSTVISAPTSESISLTSASPSPLPLVE